MTIIAPSGAAHAVVVPLNWEPDPLSTFEFRAISSVRGVAETAASKMSGLTLTASVYMTIAFGAGDLDGVDWHVPAMWQLWVTEPAGSPALIASGVLYVTKPESVPALFIPPKGTAPAEPAATHLRLYRGDTVELVLEVTVGGVPVDLTGGTLFFTLKTSPSDADNAALLSKVSGSGITVTDAAEGRAVVTLADTETLSLPLYTVLHFDVQLKRHTGAIHTVQRGTILFEQHVTVRTT